MALRVIAKSNVVLAPDPDYVNGPETTIRLLLRISGREVVSVAMSFVRFRLPDGIPLFEVVYGRLALYRPFR